MYVRKDLFSTSKTPASGMPKIAIWIYSHLYISTKKKS